jgi:hypothetical protein
LLLSQHRHNMLRCRPQPSFFSASGTCIVYSLYKTLSRKRSWVKRWAIDVQMRALHLKFFAFQVRWQ